jgi:spore germination cell wall hydrolase CwlJ-like protein
MADLTGLRNRKFHEILAQGAASTAPTPSWGAGLARALQGGIAGLIERGDDQQQREALPALLQILQGQPAQQTATPSAPSQSAPLATALARPPAPANADQVTEAKTPQDYINRAWGGLTPQGRDVSTRTVMAEADNQGPVGMAGVADVMRNRAVSGGYGGNTMGEVATAKNQFEPHNTAAGRQKMQSYNPMSPAYAGAQSAVDTASIGSRPDVTGGASYFYSPREQERLSKTDGRPVVPSFAKGEPSAVIGGHNFYREKGQAAPQAQPQQVAQAMPQQPGSKGGLSDTQAQQLRAMASHPNKLVRDYAASLASTAIANRFKPADYDIKFEKGVMIFTNKNDPRDRQVVNDPAIVEALRKNEADTAYATTKATKQAERDVAEPDRRKNELTQGGIVVQDIDRSLKGMDKATLPTTGLAGKTLSYVPGTASHDVGQLIETIKANAGFQQLMQMRQASPTGGALGNVTERELSFLQSAIGNLSQSQNEIQLRDNLKRVKNAYLDAIHGTGNGQREKLDFESKGASGKTSGGVSWSVN